MSGVAAPSDLAFLTIAEARALLRKRAVSSVELTEAALGALAALHERTNVVAELTVDLARKQARVADRRLRASEPPPLCGIPYGAKDLLATKDIPTRWGAPPYRDQVFDHDATVIERLREAGAVLVGKLAMLSLAGAGGYRFASASLGGATRNPWSASHWAGGSSSGSSATVSAGVLPFAIGSETGGSIIIPASFCGISGLRPSYGAVSRYGAMPVAWSCDKLGPLARSAADCEAVFDAIAGPDPRDATTADRTYRPSRRAPVRVGVLPFDFSGYPETERVFSDALRALRSEGLITRRVKLPRDDIRTIYRAISAAETSAAQGDLASSGALEDLVDEGQRSGLRAAFSAPAAAYARAAEERIAAVRDVRALFRDVDVLVAPTTVTEATRLEDDLDEWRPLPHYGALGALVGLPGLSVPMGFGRSGLPLGLHIIGDLFADKLVLRAGALFQRATDWHLRRPPLPTSG